MVSNIVKLLQTGPSELMQTPKLIRNKENTGMKYSHSLMMKSEKRQTRKVYLVC